MGENYQIAGNFRWLGGELKSSAELCLTECGIEQCLPDKFYGPTIRKGWHVHVILNGRGYFRVADKTYAMRRGQIFVTPPDIEIYYWAEPSDSWHYTWVSILGTKADYFLQKAGFSTESPVRDAYIEPEAFLELTKKILDHHELTAENTLLCASYLYEFMALLIQSYRTGQSQQSPPDYAPDLYVSAAVDYIQRHYSEIRISDIAEYVGISRYYLTAIFKEQLKMSPQQYLLNYRMSIASQQLIATDLSVQEIAENVGYQNPLSFSKVFKSAYGMSPKHFRISQTQNKATVRE